MFLFPFFHYRDMALTNLKKNLVIHTPNVLQTSLPLKKKKFPHQKCEKKVPQARAPPYEPRGDCRRFELRKPALQPAVKLRASCASVHDSRTDRNTHPELLHNEAKSTFVCSIFVFCDAGIPQARKRWKATPQRYIHVYSNIGKAERERVETRPNLPARERAHKQTRSPRCASTERQTRAEANEQKPGGARMRTLSGTETRY